MQRDFLCLQQRPELLQRKLEILRYRMRVGAELALYHQKHAGHSIDRRSTNRRRGALNDARQIRQTDRLAVAISDNQAADIRELVGLRVGLDDNVLIRRLDKPGAGHTGRVSGGLDHFFE